MHLQENTLFDLDLKVNAIQNVTSCDLCTCKIWSCYIQQFMRCIYKTIHYLTLMTTWKVSIMCSMYLLSLKLLCPTVQERIQLQETWWTDGRTNRQWTHYGMKLNILYFSILKLAQVNAPIATKVFCFSRLLKFLRNSLDPDQTAPIGAVCSGSTLFASILNSSVMLGNYLQQTTSDDICRCIFFLAL